MSEVPSEGSTITVDEALALYERWSRGGVALTNRQDVTGALAEEVKRLRAERGDHA